MPQDAPGSYVKPQRTVIRTAGGMACGLEECLGRAERKSLTAVGTGRTGHLFDAVCVREWRGMAHQPRVWSSWKSGSI
jgi:hypothetical protein